MSAISGLRRFSCSINTPCSLRRNIRTSTRCGSNIEPSLGWLPGRRHLQLSPETPHTDLVISSSAQRLGCSRPLSPRAEQNGSKPLSCVNLAHNRQFTYRTPDLYREVGLAGVMYQALRTTLELSSMPQIATRDQRSEERR